MCLAIPMKLIEVEGDKGIVELSGIKKEVSLKLLDEVKKGDYLIIHAGFAIQRVDEEDAQETFKIWEEIDKLEDR
ncbi:HypC/HybG/HupF family hydrogenase formation chaperone [candidate division WOR-3 bacterium]|nr:HypC/HybG/HupF family hydrogenase formation chaperone [candidate division WOR-3 bacterium]